MELNAEERNLLGEIESEGGKRWEQFRARRNQWIRKGKPEDWATWRSLQNITGSNVIQIPPTGSELNRGDWSLVYVSVGIWFVLTGYQVILHAETFGNGFHGYFVAICLEVVLAFLALLKIDNPHKEVVRWAAVITLMGFLISSIFYTTKQRAIDNDPQYLRAIAHHERLQTNYDDTDEGATKTRRRIIEMLEESSRKLTEIEQKHSKIGIFHQLKDLNTQICIVFMIAQVTASHVLGRVVFHKNSY